MGGLRANTEKIEIRLDFKGKPDGQKRPSKYAGFGITKDQLENLDGVTVMVNTDLLLRLNRLKQ